MDSQALLESLGDLKIKVNRKGSRAPGGSVL